MARLAAREAAGPVWHWQPMQHYQPVQRGWASMALSAHMALGQPGGGAHGVRWHPRVRWRGPRRGHLITSSPKLYIKIKYLGYMQRKELVWW
jgi:anaerobic selenocysteine-containing dehydrogenase